MQHFRYKSLRCLAAAALCTILSLLMLCSTTWAWYSDRISTNRNRITSASFDFTVTVDEASTRTGYELTLQKSNAVNIRLDPATASASGGYCMVQLKGDDGIYAPIACTSYFEATSSFSFQLKGDAEMTLRLIPCWGTPSQDVLCGKQGECLLITDGVGVWSAHEASGTA